MHATAILVFIAVGGLVIDATSRRGAESSGRSKSSRGPAAQNRTDAKSEKKSSEAITSKTTANSKRRRASTRGSGSSTTSPREKIRRRVVADNGSSLLQAEESHEDHKEKAPAEKESKESEKHQKRRTTRPKDSERHKLEQQPQEQKTEYVKQLEQLIRQQKQPEQTEQRQQQEHKQKSQEEHKEGQQRQQPGLKVMMTAGEYLNYYMRLASVISVLVDELIATVSSDDSKELLRAGNIKVECAPALFAEVEHSTLNTLLEAVRRRRGNEHAEADVHRVFRREFPRLRAMTVLRVWLLRVAGALGRFATGAAPALQFSAGERYKLFALKRSLEAAHQRLYALVEAHVIEPIRSRNEQNSRVYRVIMEQMIEYMDELYHVRTERSKRLAIFVPREIRYMAEGPPGQFTVQIHLLNNFQAGIIMPMEFLEAYAQFMVALVESKAPPGTMPEAFLHFVHIYDEAVQEQVRSTYGRVMAHVLEMIGVEAGDEEVRQLFAGSGDIYSRVLLTLALLRRHARIVHARLVYLNASLNKTAELTAGKGESKAPASALVVFSGPASNLNQPANSAEDLASGTAKDLRRGSEETSDSTSVQIPFTSPNSTSAESLKLSTSGGTASKSNPIPEKSSDQAASATGDTSAFLAQTRTLVERADRRLRALVAFVDGLRERILSRANAKDWRLSLYLETLFGQFLGLAEYTEHMTSAPFGMWNLEPQIFRTMFSRTAAQKPGSHPGPSTSPPPQSAAETGSARHS